MHVGPHPHALRLDSLRSLAAAAGADTTARRRIGPVSKRGLANTEYRTPITEYRCRGSELDRDANADAALEQRIDPRTDERARTCAARRVEKRRRPAIDVAIVMMGAGVGSMGCCGIAVMAAVRVSIDAFLIAEGVKCGSAGSCDLHGSNRSRDPSVG